MAVNDRLPEPLAGKPMDVVLFVQLKIVPVTAPLNAAVAVEPLHTTTFETALTVGIGFTVSVALLDITKPELNELETTTRYFLMNQRHNILCIFFLIFIVQFYNFVGKCLSVNPPVTSSTFKRVKISNSFFRQNIFRSSRTRTKKNVYANIIPGHAAGPIPDQGERFSIEIHKF